MTIVTLWINTQVYAVRHLSLIPTASDQNESTFIGCQYKRDLGLTLP